MISKIRTILDVVRVWKPQSEIAKLMRITEPGLVRLAKKRDSEVTIGEVRGFCAAVGIDETVFSKLTAAELKRVVTGPAMIFPQLMRLVAGNGTLQKLKAELFSKYVLFNVALSNPEEVYVSLLEIGEQNGAGIEFTHEFPEHGGQQIRGSGHVLPAGGAIFFVGEYDNNTHYPYMMVLQGQSRKKHSLLYGIGTSVSMADDPLACACRLVAQGFEAGTDLPHPLGSFSPDKLEQAEVRQALYAGGTGRLVRPRGLNRLPRQGEAA